MKEILPDVYETTDTYIVKVQNLLKEKFLSAPPLAHLHSFGCQQNVSDGEKIKGLLGVLGYGFTDIPGQADLILYNTCAVRESAEMRVFGNLGELKHLKEQNPELVIGLCGCMAQQETVVEKIKKTYRHVDMVFGTFALSAVPELIYEVLSQRRRVYEISQQDSGIFESEYIIRDSAFKASVPIMYGCNNFCSYCIVPYVRGRERSREPQVIVEEVRQLVLKGYKEILLLGQNVNSYGRGLGEDITFAGLLKELNALEGDFKLRFMSSHPKDASRELIDAIFECDKVAKHLHLPFQSGSDRILRAMNRNYTIENYLKIIDYARQRDPGFSFTSDVIVGFPNETEEDFQQTLDVLRYVKYDNVFTFIYSRRTGTKAADMADSTPEEDKSRRMRELLALQREISSEHYKRFLGKHLTVLAENEGKREGFLTGHSDEFIIVEFKAPKEIIGRYVQVRITAAHNWALTGEIIQ